MNSSSSTSPRSRATAPKVEWIRGGLGPTELTMPSSGMLALGGVPGSGKSTLLAGLQIPAEVVVVSADELRRDEQVRQGYSREEYISDCWGPALELMDELIHEALREGRPVIHEMTFLSSGFRNDARRRARRHGRALDLLIVDCDAQERRDAMKQRRSPVGEDMLRHYESEWSGLRQRLLLDSEITMRGWSQVTVADRAACRRLTTLALR